ncbi:DUF4136 domain-containing protein [Nonlabens marinus]|uniref:Lipoprotein, putative n=1 Tax=Nonlabens marinus S1-08 TaxID=1454201 RepID=W8VRC4_9FLAO|nr:DUF4136 domain-containing protein [Nonlabens marinus]BAO55575.1 lipoprotein, putative [Nonlabens marinus S1-08]
MNYLKTLLLIAVATGIYSCGPAVTTTKPTNDSLKKYSTFAYLPNAAIDMPENSFSADSVNAMVLQQVNDKMMDAGYELDRSNPDLLVLVSTKVNQQTETDTDPVYARYGFYNRPGLNVNPYYNNYYYRGYSTYPTVVGYDTDTYQYKDGTLIVQLVDRESRETVWKGISSTSIYDSSTTVALTNLVNAIFEEYPLMNN